MGRQGELRDLRAFVYLKINSKVDELAKSTRALGRAKIGRAEHGLGPAAKEQQTQGRVESTQETDELSKLFTGYHAEMTRKARKLLAIAGVPQSAGDADDIVSSAFAEAVEHRDKLRHPRAFVYLKINSKVDELARKQARRARLERKRAADPLRCDGLPVVPDFSTQAADRMRVQDALFDMPDQQSTAVLVTMGLGYTREETAELMGVRPGTVAQHVWRGKVALQTVLAVIVAIILIPIGILTGGVADGGVIASIFPWLDRRDERERRDKRE